MNKHDRENLISLSAPFIALVIFAFAVGYWDWRLAKFVFMFLGILALFLAIAGIVHWAARSWINRGDDA